MNFILSTDWRSVYLLELLILCQGGGNTILTPDQNRVCTRTDPASELRAHFGGLIGWQSLCTHTYTLIHTHTALACRSAQANTCQSTANTQTYTASFTVTHTYQSMLSYIWYPATHINTHSTLFTTTPTPPLCGLRVSAEPLVQTATYPPLLYNMFGARPLIKDPQSSINLRVSHRPFICSLLSLRPTRRALTLKWMRWRDGWLLYTREWPCLNSV